MADILDFTSGRRWAERRSDWAPPTPGSFGLRPRAEPGERIGSSRVLPPRPTRAVVNPLFFNVRSFACGDRTHTLQLGFVDASANVVFSVFSKWPSDGALEPGTGDPRLSVEPVDPEPLNRMLASVCRDAELVGFHRVLQGGLLPQSAIGAAASLTCAWRRVQEAAKTRRLYRTRERPITLNDALQFAGLKPMETDDAVMRALAIRELWLWLDRLG
ncbi:MAG TPA: hypothetical protein VL358_07175 [Caulobacteraceae bacterium]|jgi:hypothetical protein|nr:hypothetical protein [Caulobacteraceae bacterium]